MTCMILPFSEAVAGGGGESQGTTPLYESLLEIDSGPFWQLTARLMIIDTNYVTH